MSRIKIFKIDKKNTGMRLQYEYCFYEEKYNFRTRRWEKYGYRTKIEWFAERIFVGLRVNGPMGPPWGPGLGLGSWPGATAHSLPPGPPSCTSPPYCTATVQWLGNSLLCSYF
jgi:hypothetical protein